MGETVPRIRVPVVYRYHIELAPEWRVLRSRDLFTVVAPPGKPSLPVAVDLSRIDLEKLRDEFARKVKHKATAIEDIRKLVERKLALLVDWLRFEPTSVPD